MSTPFSPQTAVADVRRLRSAAERERTGWYYIEGARIVEQALNAQAPFVAGVIAPDLLRGEHAFATVAALKASGAPVVELSRSAFESISFKENLQGIGAVVEIQRQPLSSVQLTAEEVWVALDNVGNPGNLGAIMRTGDATGCAGLLLLGNTTDPYHPAAIRASMGSFFALQMVRASFDEFMQWAKAQNVPVIGTTPDAEVEYQAVRYPRPCVVLMGSERLGLTPAQQAACDLQVRIPMVGNADSLNLGVATSLELYAVFLQGRRASSAGA